MRTPSWVQDAIFYQIFPDRFAKSKHAPKLANTQTWGSTPTYNGFMGGDLRGIIENFDYLLDLGINAIYLNPIFQSSANHRYHTVDYYMVDHRLGTMEDFYTLLDVAHANHVKIIIDGVFNHCGRGFFPFNDLLENGKESAFADWFIVKNFPLNAYAEGQTPNYEAWWNMPDLPKLNTDNPEVRAFIMDVARFWIDQGADGWRLDVPGEIDDDDFWREFCDTVKTANPDAYILGEIWEVAPKWVDENHFDGLMNYPLRAAMLDLLRYDTDVNGFAERLNELTTVYERENQFAMYLSMGSHDRKRALFALDGNKDKVKLLHFLAFAFPGAPAIYYGDEIGLDGGKDPLNRAAFPWDKKQWDLDTLVYFKRLISIRKAFPSLRRGDYKELIQNNDLRYFAFTRQKGDETITAVLNANNSYQQITLPVVTSSPLTPIAVKNLITDEIYNVEENAVTFRMKPWTGAFLLPIFAREI